MVTLNGEQQGRLTKALLSAFPNRRDLEMLVKFQLNQSLDAIASPGNLEHVIYDVVQWAEKMNRMADLIRGAQERNTDNSLLRQFVADIHFVVESTAMTRALSLLQIRPVEKKADLFPPNALLTSQQYVLTQRTTSAFYREDLFLAPMDASRRGISGERFFAILAIPSLNPGLPPRQFAVRLATDMNMAPGTIEINHHFASAIGLQTGRPLSWWVLPAPRVVMLEEADIELVVESENIKYEREKIARQRQDLLVNRCLLLEQTSETDSLSLRVNGWGYFNLRNIRLAQASLTPGSIVCIYEKTRTQLFVPHKKNGVDMVILVDASASMTWEDFVDLDGQPHSRMRGVKRALETLFQRRLSSGSRVSRLAIVAFSGNTAMLYPETRLNMVEVGNDLNDSDDMRSSLRKLNDTYLGQMLDRNHTNISLALREGADLLTMCCQDGNEKIFLLLSDGADWTEITDNQRYGEVAGTTDDPAVLAEKLYDEENIHVYSVSISNEQAFRRWIPSQHWHNRTLIPNTALLQRMSTRTNGIFFESPDARVLGELFDALGRGTFYSLM